MNMVMAGIYIWFRGTMLGETYFSFSRTGKHVVAILRKLRKACKSTKEVTLPQIEMGG